MESKHANMDPSTVQWMVDSKSPPMAAIYAEILFHIASGTCWEPAICAQIALYGKVQVRG